MKTALTVLLLLAASMTAMAHNTANANDNENEREWKLESVEMEPRLTVTEKESLSFGLNDNLNVNPEINRMATSNSTNVKPYTFFQDQTYVGIPLFLAGVIAKSEKRSFRQNTADLRNSRTRLLTNFHSEIDRSPTPISRTSRLRCVPRLRLHQEELHDGIQSQRIPEESHRGR